MFKKLIIVLVIVSIVSISLFSSSPLNVKNEKKESKLSKKVVPLNDQELEKTSGQGIWECLVAAGIWTAAVLGVGEVKTVATLFGVSFGVLQAYANMYNECNYLTW